MHFDKISDQFLYIFFQITFCLTIWFILKQLDNLPSFSMNDSLLNCALLTIVHRKLWLVV